MENAAQVNQPMTEKAAAKRMVTQAIYSTIVPQQVICQLVGGGVPERYPDLHFALIEFNAHWLASTGGQHGQVLGRPGSDKTRTGGWASGTTAAPRGTELAWRSCSASTRMAVSAMPSEYVQRQFHVSFQDDPVAVACRHITGVVDDRVGQRLPARRGHVPGQQGAHGPALRGRAGRRACRHGRWHAGPDPRVQRSGGRSGAPELGHPPESAALRGGQMSTYSFEGRVAIVTGARSRDRPSPRAPAGRPRSERRRQRPGRHHRWPRSRRRGGVRSRGRDRGRRRHRDRGWQRCGTAGGAQALIDSAVDGSDASTSW